MWVKRRKAQCEHKVSAVHPTTDMRRLAGTLTGGLRITPAFAERSKVESRRRSQPGGGFFMPRWAALRRGPNALPAGVPPASILACSSALACPVSSDAGRNGGFALFRGRCVRYERGIVMGAERKPEQFDDALGNLLLRFPH